jgi:hypothetical protein
MTFVPIAGRFVIARKGKTGREKGSSNLVTTAGNTVTTGKK